MSYQYSTTVDVTIPAGTLAAAALDLPALDALWSNYSMNAATLAQTHPRFAERASGRDLLADLCAAVAITDPEITTSSAGLTWLEGTSRTRFDGSHEAVWAFLARHGATGTVICEGEDGKRWRWTLAEGHLAEDELATVTRTHLDTALADAQTLRQVRAALDLPPTADAAAILAAISARTPIPF